MGTVTVYSITDAPDNPTYVGGGLKRDDVTGEFEAQDKSDERRLSKLYSKLNGRWLEVDGVKWFKVKKYKTH